MGLAGLTVPAFPHQAACPAHLPPPTPRAQPPSPQNDATKNEANKEMVRIRKQVDYWKEQAGLPAAQRDIVDLLDVTDARQGPDGPQASERSKPVAAS